MRQRAVMPFAVAGVLCLLLATSGCARQAPSGNDTPVDVPVSSRWQVDHVGGMTGGRPVWWTKGVAWTEGGAADVPRSFYLFDARKQVTSILCESPPETEDSCITWSRGRFYWLRSAWRATDHVYFRTELLSMAPGEATPTVMRIRAAMDGLCAAGDRLAWIEREGGSKRWSTMTMGGSEATPTLVSAAGTEYVDLALSDRMLVWASVKDPKVVRLLPLGPTGQLAVTPTVLLVGEPTADYQEGTLCIDGPRIAWTARGTQHTWHVYTWRFGDVAPQRVSMHASRRPPESVFAGSDEDVNTGLTNPVVAGDRISWRSWDHPASSMLTWQSGEPSPTVLGAYLNPDYVSLVAASDEGVAWTISTRGGEREGDSLHSIMTWGGQPGRAQTVATGRDPDDEIVNLSVRGDSIAFSGCYRTTGPYSDGGMFLADR